MKRRLTTPSVLLAGMLSAAAALPTVPLSPVEEGIDPTWRTISIAFAATLALGICVIAASIAMARIGTAALGAAAEKPELLMRSLLFIALAEGLGVLGFAVAILLIQKI